MALIDDEGALAGLAEAADLQLVGAEQVEHLDGAVLAALVDALDVAAAVPGDEAEVEPADARRRSVQQVEAVPAVIPIPDGHHAVALGDGAGGAQNAGTVRPCQAAHATAHPPAPGPFRAPPETPLPLGHRA